ncbi:hypothetical protein [Mesorhizobium amorphae]|uniref:hypothetical protein n=1 Tax=Mesorhizobium amorphae TaxID=71433 RepID=UPI0021B34E8B|nr:hypothetical protein [Mesorhizobium amorphae]
MLAPVRSATRAMVKRLMPSRASTWTAASRIAATSSAERACRGFLVCEIVGRRGGMPVLAMKATHS